MKTLPLSIGFTQLRPILIVRLTLMAMVFSLSQAVGLAKGVDLMM
jgi:hypothetical protein